MISIPMSDAHPKNPSSVVPEPEMAGNPLGEIPDAIHEVNDLLNSEVWSPLDKEISNVSAAFKSCPSIPSSSMHMALSKTPTMDASTLLPVAPTKSFCTRYLESMNRKSHSKGPKTPLGSPATSRKSSMEVGNGESWSRNSSLNKINSSELLTRLKTISSIGSFCRSSSGSLMTPPVTTVCSLAAGPLLTDANIDVNDNTAAMCPTGQAEEPMETGEAKDNDATNTKETENGNTENENEISAPLPPVLSPIRSFGGPGTFAACPMIPHDGPAPVEIAFSFDTTGSMSQCIDEVRIQLRDIIQRLLGDVPHLKIAVVAHGDYCDETEFYTLKYVDFTNDVNMLTQFVNDVSGTGGGDWEECYEYVLFRTRGLSWTAGTQKSLVMIGDAIPHKTNDTPMKLDWRHQADLLLSELGVHIYAVQCQKSANDKATPFWNELAARTGGKHIAMEQFSTVVDLMLAICYRETGPEFLQAYEKEVRMREGVGINADLKGMFASLRDDAACGLYDTSDDETALPSVTTAKTIKKPRVKASKITARKIEAVRKKVFTAAKIPSKMNKQCSCVWCDVKLDSSKTAGERCTCVMCFSKIPRKSSYKFRKNCSCIMCEGKPKRIVSKEIRNKNSTARVKTVSRVPKKARESVTEGSFAFRDFRWSNWKLAMCAVGNTSRLPGKWEPCRYECRGLMRSDLFRTAPSGPIVCEVAIQSKIGSKKIVTSCKVVKGIHANRFWDHRLISKSLLAGVVDKALYSNCKIFVRWAPIAPQRKTVKINGRSFKLKSANQLKNFMIKTYDYAWQKRQIDGALGTRLITRSDIILSGPL